MFRDSSLSKETHRKLYSTTASYQFKRNLAVVNPANYELSKETAHCYFTEKGMEDFGKYVEEFRNILVTEIEVKFSVVKENIVMKCFTNSFF